MTRVYAKRVYTKKEFCTWEGCKNYDVEAELNCKIGSPRQACLEFEEDVVITQAENEKSKVS